MPPYRTIDHTPSNMKKMNGGRRGSSEYDYDDDSSLRSNLSYESYEKSTPSKAPRRSPSRARNSAHGSVVMNGTFQKLLMLLLVVVIFDLVYVWDYFDGVDEHSGGPEAGIHHLHGKNRLSKMYEEVWHGLKPNLP